MLKQINYMYMILHEIFWFVSLVLKISITTYSICDTEQTVHMMKYFDEKKRQRPLTNEVIPDLSTSVLTQS